MKRVLKYIGAVLLILAAGAGLFFAVNRAEVSTFPSILSSWYAKEFCSCLYVVGRDETFCHNYTRQRFEISEFKHDKSTRTVTVSGLGRVNSARYAGPGLGCVHTGDLH